MTPMEKVLLVVISAAILVTIVYLASTGMIFNMMAATVNYMNS
jgi:hypothetical protein